MQQKIVIGNDLTVLFTGGMDIGHVLPIPCFEFPATIQYIAPVNEALGHHMLAQSVQHQSQPVAQGFHDCGRLIGHISPYDVAAGPAQSSRQIMFSAMDVLVEGEPIGFGTNVGIPTPMLSCGLLPMAVGDAITSAGNGVIVGMDPEWDYLLCWQGIAVEIAVSAILSSASLAANAIGGAGASIVKEAAEELLEQFFMEGVRYWSPGQQWVEGWRARRGTARLPATPGVRSTSEAPSTWDLI